MKLYQITPEGNSEFITRLETRNERATFHNTIENNIIVPETRYRIDMTVLNTLVRSQQTCTKEVTTKPIPPMKAMI